MKNQSTGQPLVLKLSVVVAMLLTAVGFGPLPSAGPAIAQTAPIPVDTPYQALQPARLLETRSGYSTVDGQQNNVGRLGSGSITKLTIIGRAGMAASGIGSVVLNVTAVNPQGPGYITAWPTGLTQPLASNLNYAANQIVPNLVITKVGADGTVSVFTSAATDLVVDVAGYFPTTSSFVGLQPARLFDSRPGYSTIDSQQAGTGLISMGAETVVVAVGRGGVPATGIKAVVLNVTAVDPTSPGYLTVSPYGGGGTTSNLNFAAGQTVPNLVVTGVSNGTVTITHSASRAHLVVDVMGYFPATSPFRPLQPMRLLDTRPGTFTFDGQQAAAGRLGPGTVTKLAITRRGEIPDRHVGSVVLNLTVTQPTGSGFVTVWPSGQPRPTASNLNFSDGQTTANAVIVKVGDDGTVSIFNSTATHLIADVTGWFPKPLSPVDCMTPPPTRSTVGRPDGPDLTIAASVCEPPDETAALSLAVVVRNQGTKTTQPITVHLIEAAIAGLPVGTNWQCNPVQPEFCTYNGPAAQGETLPTLYASIAANHYQDFLVGVSVAGDVNPFNDESLTFARARSVDVPDLALSVGPASVAQIGDQVVFEVLARNLGKVTASGPIRITWNPSLGAVAWSGSGPGWTCDSAGCTQPAALASSATLPKLTIRGDSPDIQVDIHGQANELDQSNNSATSHFDLLAKPIADLVASISVPTVPIEGDNATFVTTITNAGGAAFSRPIQVSLSAAKHYANFAIDSAGSNWTCVLTTCTYPGPIAAGASLPPILSTTVAEAGTLQLYASLQMRGSDIQFNSNANAVSTVVVASSATSLITPLEPFGTSLSLAGRADPTGEVTTSLHMTVSPRGNLASAPLVELPATFNPQGVSGAGWSCQLRSCKYTLPISRGEQLPTLSWSHRFNGANDFLNTFDIVNVSAGNPNPRDLVLQYGMPIQQAAVGAILQPDGPPLLGMPATGKVTVKIGNRDALVGPIEVSFGYSPDSEMTAPGWDCTIANVCRYSGVLTPGKILPFITLKRTSVGVVNSYSSLGVSVAAPNDLRIKRTQPGGLFHTTFHPSSVGTAVTLDGPGSLNFSTDGSIWMTLPLTYGPGTPITVTETDPAAGIPLGMSFDGEGWSCEPAGCTYVGVKTPGSNLPPLNFSLYLRPTDARFSAGGVSLKINGDRVILGAGT